MVIKCYIFSCRRVVLIHTFTDRSVAASVVYPSPPLPWSQGVAAGVVYPSPPPPWPWSQGSSGEGVKRTVPGDPGGGGRNPKLFCPGSGMRGM
eukprot:7799335-Pyramimonas_sp.AAC.1